MNNDTLKIPKKLQQLELYVYPDGKVIGSIYLHLQSSRHTGEEKPEEMVNQPEPFLVVRCKEPDSFRIYNKKFIIWIKYHNNEQAQESTALMRLGPDRHMLDLSAEMAGFVRLNCQLYLVDRSKLSGVIEEFLPPGHQRLFDFVNNNASAFVKLYLESGEICLVNKAYIVRLSSD
ncbi:MAG: hypothetical protein ACREVE_10330 [Gammaproteobacteria bacterium]